MNEFILFLAMTFRQRLTTIDEECQRNTILFFDDCNVCIRLAGRVIVCYGVAKRAVQNKENNPTGIWTDAYQRYLIHMYRLDYHCNKKHDKIKHKKIDIGEMHNVAKISIINRLPDVPLGGNINCVVEYIYEI